MTGAPSQWQAPHHPPIVVARSQHSALLIGRREDPKITGARTTAGGHLGSSVRQTAAMIALQQCSTGVRPGHRCHPPASELLRDSRPTIGRLPKRQPAAFEKLSAPACMSLAELRLPAVGFGLLASGMLLLGSPASAAEVLTGVPRTVDGDTLVVRTAALLVWTILPADLPLTVHREEQWTQCGMSNW